MDALSFVAQVLTATAWPICALIIALALRGPVVELIPLLRKLKWKGLEAEFGRGLVHARELMETEVTSVSPRNQSFPEKDRELLDNFAEVAPRHVVLECWREVEAAVIRAAHKSSAGQKLQHARASLVAAQALLDSGQIGNAEFQVFTILKNLRNRAAHERDFELSRDDAIEYADTTRWLVRVLEEVSKRRGEHK